MSGRYGTIRSTIALVVALLVGGVGLSGHACPHHASSTSGGDRPAQAHAHDGHAAERHAESHSDASSHPGNSGHGESHGDPGSSCDCVGFCQTVPIHAALVEGGDRLASAAPHLTVRGSEPSTAILPARLRWTLPLANAPPLSSPARSV